MRLLGYIALSTGLLANSTVALQSPLICEDSINNQPPFNFNDVPCLLGCGEGVTRATGSLLPGSVNVTDTPYCRLNCVHKNATPAQSSAAPSCNAQCENGNSATPDQLGWCVYWCVAGEQSVISTTCIPELQYTPVSTSTLATYTNAPDEVVTIDGFTQLPAWSSWYQTQTDIPRSCNVMFGTPSECITSTASTQSSGSVISTTISSMITSSPTTSSPLTTTTQARTTTTPSPHMTSQSSTATGVASDAEAQATGSSTVTAVPTSSSRAFAASEIPLDFLVWIMGAIWTLF